MESIGIANSMPPSKLACVAVEAVVVIRQGGASQVDMIGADSVDRLTGGFVADCGTTGQDTAVAGGCRASASPLPRGTRGLELLSCGRFGENLELPSGIAWETGGLTPWTGGVIDELRGDGAIRPLLHSAALLFDVELGSETLWLFAAPAVVLTGFAARVTVAGEDARGETVVAWLPSCPPFPP